MRLSSFVACVLCTTACQGKPADPPPAVTAAKATPAAKTGEPAKEEPTKAEPRVEAKSPDSATPPGDEVDPRGARFVDPPWFRKELFPDATSAKVSRTQRDEQGMFSSQILFDLPAGTTAEQCVKTLKDAVGKDVPDLAEGPDAKQPGRVQVTGNTDRYSVHMLCGDAKGTMRAFVSFSWTNP